MSWQIKACAVAVTLGVSMAALLATLAIVEWLQGLVGG